MTIQTQTPHNKTKQNQPKNNMNEIVVSALHRRNVINVHDTVSFVVLYVYSQQVMRNWIASFCLTCIVFTWRISMKKTLKCIMGAVVIIAYVCYLVFFFMCGKLIGDLDSDRTGAKATLFSLVLVTMYTVDLIGVYLVYRWL